MIMGWAMSKGDKRPFATILPIAQRIVEGLAPHSQRIEIAGSLRRERPLIGDIEIVAVPQFGVDLFGQPDPKQNYLRAFLQEKGVEIVKGDKQPESKYIQFVYGAHKVDLFMPTPETWGSIFLIRTGSHEFNMWLMTVRSGQVGVRFEDGRLLRRFNNEVIPTPEESDVFEQLQMAFVPPNMRDDGKWLEYVR
jgi:DNA polymerase/3'-5' exonuclease PolX